MDDGSSLSPRSTTTTDDIVLPGSQRNGSRIALDGNDEERSLFFLCTSVRPDRLLFVSIANSRPFLEYSSSFAFFLPLAGPGHRLDVSLTFSLMLGALQCLPYHTFPPSLSSSPPAFSFSGLQAEPSISPQCNSRTNVPPYHLPFYHRLLLDSLWSLLMTLRWSLTTS